MQVLLKLYSTIDKATDGSKIPRHVTEEYLKSKDYELLIKNKLGLGGVTHKDRTLASEYKGLIGQDDQVIINNNATHYFKKIFFKDETDPFVYAIIELFDPKDFVGKQQENILNLLGLLKSGVKLPVSIVIHAIWDDRTDEAKKIIRIKGVDFTQNNAFPNAGIVDIGEKINIETREYSSTDAELTEYPGCKSKIKAFSGDLVIEATDKEFSLKDLLSKSGNSDPGGAGGDEGGFGDSEGGEGGSTEANVLKGVVDNIKKEIYDKIEQDIKDELENIDEEEEVKETGPDPSLDMAPEDKEAKESLTIKPEHTNESDEGNDEEDDVHSETKLGNEKTYSRADIIRIYGLNSKEADRTRYMSQVTESQLKLITASQKESLDEFLNHFTADDEVKQFFKDYLTEKGVDLSGLGALTDIPLDRGGITTVLRSVPTSDPNWKNIMGVMIDKFLRNVPKLAKYSTVNSIRDRIFIFRYPRLTVINRLLKYYKLYWEEFGSTLSQGDRIYFAEMVISDIRILLNKVINKIENNILISSLYGLNQFKDPNIVKAADELNPIYRRIILSRKILKFIPSGQYIEFKDKLTKFYQAILNYVTGGEKITINNNIRIIN